MDHHGEDVLVEAAGSKTEFNGGLRQLDPGENQLQHGLLPPMLKGFPETLLHVPEILEEILDPLDLRERYFLLPDDIHVRCLGQLGVCPGVGVVRPFDVVDEVPTKRISCEMRGFGVHEATVEVRAYLRKGHLVNEQRLRKAHVPPLQIIVEVLGVEAGRDVLVVEPDGADLFDGLVVAALAHVAEEIQCGRYVIQNVLIILLFILIFVVLPAEHLQRERQIHLLMLRLFVIDLGLINLASIFLLLLELALQDKERVVIEKEVIVRD